VTTDRGTVASRREVGARNGVPKRSRIRAIQIAVVLIHVVMTAAVGGALWYLLESSDHDIAPGTPVVVEIPSGTSTADIAEILSSAGVIKNANRFRLESRLAEADADLRAGEYELVTGMTYDDAIDALVTGPEIRYTTVTIPEGFVIDQIAARYEELAGIPASEFLDLAYSGYEAFPRGYLLDAYEGSLEGYLFPKTYRVEEGATARDVIDMMLDQFEKEMEQVDIGPALERGFTAQEVVTMASIIEREAQLDVERPLVSSVIHNRLGIGMRLEIDATIEYILPGNTFRLRNSDLEIESPYNTYKHTGLTPGPISNPGLASLQAAAAPADTDYIYYVLTGLDGSHTFTVTWGDFLKAKARSKEVFGK
jgi:UPF0755 protein